ncbi:MAG: hypothetical protein WAM14_18445 [Candidatus Nitrosopolaris sp.]
MKEYLTKNNIKHKEFKPQEVAASWLLILLGFRSIHLAGVTIYAYTATDLSYLGCWAAGQWDHLSGGSSIGSPTVINGKVYLATNNTLNVYTLKPQ